MKIWATDHVHANSCILNYVLDKNNSHTFLVRDKSIISVTATRHTKFQVLNSHHPLYLNDVLCSSLIIKNLTYVCKFIHQNNCSIEFDEFSFTVKGYRTRLPLVLCDSGGPLYPIILSLPQAHVFLCLATTSWSS